MGQQNGHILILTESAIATAEEKWGVPLPENARRDIERDSAVLSG